MRHYVGRQLLVFAIQRADARPSRWMSTCDKPRPGPGGGTLPRTKTDPVSETLLVFLEYHTMDKVQKLRNPDCTVCALVSYSFIDFSVLHLAVD
jgi:hypothetical protein